MNQRDRMLCHKVAVAEERIDQLQRMIDGKSPRELIIWGATSEINGTHCMIPGDAQINDEIALWTRFVAFCRKHMNQEKG